MKTIELEFLLTLLGFENYRALLSKIKLHPTISDTEQEEICRKLHERGFLMCSYKINKFKIAAPGKFLLKQDSDQIPITKQERKVLKASAKDTITPKETGLPAKERQAVIQSLADRGLIEVETKRKKINEVWLTERGKENLQYEYEPSETSFVLSSELLTNYIQFLRKAFQEVSPRSSMAIQTQIISDDNILLTIVELERQLATDNRLPICYVREKLHPLVLRDELDEVLYRLQQLDKIELSPLQAANACGFTSAQIDAGIPQESGPPLFFVALK
jgi:predicted transcriptional regulator